MSPMPIAVSYQTLGLVWRILKLVLSFPIVKTALDNWTKGTTNEVDNWVWAWLKKKMQLGGELNPVVLEAEVAGLQRKYDEAKAAGILVSLKAPVQAWDSAALVLSSGPSSGNIG